MHLLVKEAYIKIKTLEKLKNLQRRGSLFFERNKKMALIT